MSRIFESGRLLLRQTGQLRGSGGYWVRRMRQSDENETGMRHKLGKFVSDSK